MRYLYSALLHLLRPLAFAVVLWRGLRNRQYWVGLGERFGFGGPLDSAPTIWLHAVSLGEVNAAAPLIRELRARHPQLPLVLTSATPTGRERAEELFGESITVRYVPYDTPGAMRRFIAAVRPRLVIIMETELWPNLFNECRRRGIPVVLANARLSHRSVMRYRRFGGLFRRVLSDNTQVAAQSAEDAERFVAVGAERSRTHVIGNLKFDISIDAALLERGRELRAACWGARLAWIAGSTHAGEEESVLTAHAALRGQAAGALLLLVPRHPQRFEAVAELLRRQGIRFERRSRIGVVPADTQVVLVDTVGELGALYGAVDVAFVGGSLVPVGGHNLLEPAALGVPIVTGPYQANGKEIADLLVREGAALVAANAAELAAAVNQLFADPERRRRMGSSGLRAVLENRGSLSRLFALLEPILSAGH